MITKINEPIYRQSDGNYIIRINGAGYGVCDNNLKEKYTIEMVEAYLAEHPEALVPEPLPPKPGAEEKKTRKDAEDEAKELELDRKWIREQRKKAGK
jgi:hypothetical protein